MDEIIGEGSGATVRAVRNELWNIWLPARSRGEPRPPPSRVTFSRRGWLDFLSDPEIRQVYMPADPISGASVFLGAEVVIDREQAEPFVVSLRGDEP